MNRLNRGMHAAAAEALAPGPGDRVLEVGFGGGTLLEELLRRTPEGRVTGLELSDTMLHGPAAGSAATSRPAASRSTLRKAGFAGIVSRSHGHGTGAFVVTETGAAGPPSDGMPPARSTRPPSGAR